MDWGPNHVRKVSTEAVEELAAHYGPAADIVSSPQRGLEIILDSLDAAAYDTAVLMSVASPEWVLSAVLRSRCQPVFIDAGTTNPYIKYGQLAHALSDLKDHMSCVVLHQTLFGDVVHDNLIASVPDDTVTITLSSRLPYTNKDTTFAVYDMQPAMMHGALISCGFEDAHERVRAAIARSGDYVSPYEAAIAKTFVHKEAEREARILELSKKYAKYCESRGILSLLPPSQTINAYPILVDNAAYMQAYLQGRKIESKAVLNNLAQLPYVKAIVNKDFPGADTRHNHILALPTDIKPELVPFVLDLVKEVEDRKS